MFNSSRDHRLNDQSIYRFIGLAKPFFYCFSQCYVCARSGLPKTKSHRYLSFGEGFHDPFAVKLHLTVRQRLVQFELVGWSLNLSLNTSFVLCVLCACVYVQNVRCLKRSPRYLLFGEGFQHLFWSTTCALSTFLWNPYTLCGFSHFTDGIVWYNTLESRFDSLNVQWNEYLLRIIPVGLGNK